MNVHPFITVINPKFYWALLKEVGRFTGNPARDLGESDWRSALIVFLPLLILKLILSIMAALSFYAFEALGVVSELENKVQNITDVWPLWKVLLAGGLIAPLIEEGAFRAHFRMSRWTGALAVFCIAYLLISWIMVRSAGLRGELFLDGSGTRFGMSGVMAFTIFFVLKRPGILIGLRTWWAKNFVSIFWVSMVVFGLLHIDRYSNFQWSTHGLLILLIILPQIIAAIFYSYMRMRYGFLWAVVFHGVNNMGPYLLFTYVITGPIDAL